MQALLNTAVKAARRAGDIAIRALSRLDQLEIRAKARNDYVTQVDQAAEQAILESIRERYPDHSFLAEESGHSAGRGSNSEFQWIIDPLDGTTNYLHGFPTFSVSVALRRKDTLEVGVVYDPCRQELFTAMRGGGAQLDGKRIRVSERKDLDGTLIGTGFPFRSNTRWMKTYLQMLGSVMENTAGVRRPGSAALDLSYVAAGRLDGFFEFGLEIWDTAAGTLMIQEAGGLVTSLTGKDSHLDSGDVLAG
ncbi:MAG: inositol monophosphatase family protein, partial [Gammaproteobacteria bacterium]|nr:inositol monophosphatase family protein [Gammaproteobacteria bacterium]